jgi:hypothetical protein
VGAFREGGGEGKPVCVQAKIAWDPDEAAARAGALDQWGTNVLTGDAPWELRTPAQFEQATSFVDEGDMDRAVLVSADLGRHAAWLHELASDGRGRGLRPQRRPQPARVHRDVRRAGPAAARRLSAASRYRRSPSTLNQR